MKLTLKIIIISVVFALMISCESKPKDKIIDGVITLIVHDVQTSEGSEWKKAALLERVDISKVVRTNEKSKAEIFLTDKTRILLHEKTLFVPILLTQRDKKFRFKEGYIYAKVEKLTEEENFQIFTPSATVGVRGTQFAIKTGNGTEKISVKQGTVNVKYNLPVIKKLLKHSSGTVRGIARKISKGIDIQDYEAVVIKRETVTKIKSVANKLLKNDKADDNLFNELLKITRLEKVKADIKDFTWAIEYLNKPSSKNGTPVILDGNNAETMIFVNGENVSKGKYSKVFAPGKYTFNFRLKQYRHSVTKKLSPGSEILTIKAPFPSKLPDKRQGTRRRRNNKGPYEANPDERAAN